MRREDLESIVEIASLPDFEALLRLIERLAEKQEKAVLSFNLDQGDRPLALLKARAEGARQLLADFQREVKTLKGRQ